jgi:hypothetical protein
VRLIVGQHLGVRAPDPVSPKVRIDVITCGWKHWAKSSSHQLAVPDAWLKRETQRIYGYDDDRFWFLVRWLPARGVRRCEQTLGNSSSV